MSEWQPIETAPKDGAMVLIFDQDTVTPGRFDDGCDDDGNEVDPPGWFWFDGVDTGDAEPTHWMPMPEPPK